MSTLGDTTNTTAPHDKTSTASDGSALPNPRPTTIPTFESRIPSFAKRGSVPTLSSIPASLAAASKRRTSIPVLQEAYGKTTLPIEAIPPTDSLISDAESSPSDSDSQEKGRVELKLRGTEDFEVIEGDGGDDELEKEEEFCKDNGLEVKRSHEEDEEDETSIRATEFASSGRIQVFVRVRPNLPQDPAQREKSVLIERDRSILLHDPSTSVLPPNFLFDHIFEESQCDDSIFRKVGKPIVEACLKGFNGTLIAYGQTGSGKTHTLFSKTGLLPLTLQSLYDRLSSSTSPYSIALSMIQIYQEKIYDLLANDAEVELREHPELGVYLERGTKLEAMNYQECQRLILEGYQHRIVKETLMNQASSRSHVIVFLEVSQVFGHVTKRSKLTFCDLAGSERIKKTLASGTILSEAKEINLSLLEMGNVIQSLANRKKHIPFRNSVLTRLLQESLGGNCLTYLIICVSPSKRDLPETKSSLLFGKRAMRIQTFAKVNEQVDHEKLAMELSSKLSTLESQWVEREVEFQKTVETLKQSQEETLKHINQFFSCFFPESCIEGSPDENLIQKLEELQFKLKQETVAHESQSKVFDTLVKRLVNCVTLSLEEGTTTLTKLLVSVEFLERKLESEKKERVKGKGKSRCIIQ